MGSMRPLQIWPQHAMRMDAGPWCFSAQTHLRCSIARLATRGCFSRHTISSTVLQLQWMNLWVPCMLYDMERLCSTNGSATALAGHQCGTMPPELMGAGCGVHGKESI